jgi:hypothetical protein
MNTLRPFGVTLIPKPGSAVGSASMALFVNLVRGMD